MRLPWKFWNYSQVDWKKPVFSDHKGPKGGPYENELLTIFKWKYEFPRVRARIAEEKNGVICLVITLKLQKIVAFSIFFFANVSKKFKAVIATYVYASESSRFTLLENDIGYYAMT